MKAGPLVRKFCHLAQGVR